MTGVYIFYYLQICLEMGIDAPIPVSLKDADLNNVFSRIVSAAEHPHLYVPETDVGRSKKRYRQLMNRALMCLSGTLLSFHIS